MTNTKQTGNTIQKIIFLGDSGVGKSSLIFRYFDKTFTQDYIQTIGGVNFKNKIHEKNGMTMKFQFWDTTGGLFKKRSFKQSLYSDVSGVFLCFDLTKESSFSNLGK
jgi:small GTP-binding protein